MTINWKEFISSDFWLGLDPVITRLTDKIILYAGIGLVLLGVIFLIVKIISSDRLKKPYFSRISSTFITIGLLEMLWYLLRWQYVNVLGARITAALIAIIGLLFLIRPIRYFLFNYKEDSLQMSKEQLKNRYLNMNR